MRAEEKKLLLDVQEAAQSIEQRCAGHAFETYSADRWFRRAVEREFEIIGEALNRLDRLARRRRRASPPSGALSISAIASSTVTTLWMT